MTLLQERKSISVELSYAVRFNNDEQVHSFIEQVAQELHNRAIDANVKGKTISLVVYQKHPLQQPTTYLGRSFHFTCISLLIFERNFRSRQGVHNQSLSFFERTY